MKRIDWHAGFVSAMKLELIENKDDLIFEEEHQIANRAQRIDLLRITIKPLYPGIYTLSGNLPFRTQVIIIREISPKQCTWLRSLTKHGTRSNLDSIVYNTRPLDKNFKRYADNVMDVFTSANNNLVKKELEDPTMCNAVNELFADQIKELKEVIADMGSQLADKESQLADKDALIAQLQAQLHAQGKQQRSSANS